MKVRLEDIGPEGLDVSFEATGLRAEDLGDQAAGIVRPPVAEFHLSRSGDTVRARGKVEAGLSLRCSRCLAEYPFELAAELDIYFRPHPSSQADEVELESDELEVVHFASDEIDLGQALVEEISLALPMAPVCGEDCQGLCSGCGRRLSEGDCGCQKKEVDPRLAKLAGLKIQ